MTNINDVKLVIEHSEYLYWWNECAFLDDEEKEALIIDNWLGN